MTRFALLGVEGVESRLMAGEWSSRKLNIKSNWLPLAKQASIVVEVAEPVGFHGRQMLIAFICLTPKRLTVLSDEREHERNLLAN